MNEWLFVQRTVRRRNKIDDNTATNLVETIPKISFRETVGILRSNRLTVLQHTRE